MRYNALNHGANSFPLVFPSQIHPVLFSLFCAARVSPYTVSPRLLPGWLLAVKLVWLQTGSQEKRHCRTAFLLFSVLATFLLQDHSSVNGGTSHDSPLRTLQPKMVTASHLELPQHFLLVLLTLTLPHGRRFPAWTLVDIDKFLQQWVFQKATS